MLNPNAPYVPAMPYSGVDPQNPLVLLKTTTTDFTRLTNSSIFADKALILNTGAGDIDVSMDGGTTVRTIWSGTEYEWSNPVGDRPFDLADIYVKSPVAGYVAKVLYR